MNQTRIAHSLADLINEIQELQKNENVNDDKYWKQREVWQGKLREWLFYQFEPQKETKATIIKVTQLASAYRPVEPWQYLMLFSKYNFKNPKTKDNEKDTI